MGELIPCMIAGIEGLYYKAEDVDAEIARLKGELELYQEAHADEHDAAVTQYGRAETAEARVRELEAKLDPEALTASYMAGQASRTETVRTLQDFVDELVAERTALRAQLAEVKSERDRAIKAYTDEAQAHDVTRAQLAELRAMVRPGVEEIAEIIYKEWYHIQSSNYTSIAEAIHAILPPVTPSCGVHELEKLVVESSKGCLDYGLASKSIARAIHKAMGGGE